MLQSNPGYVQSMLPHFLKDYYLCFKIKSESQAVKHMNRDPVCSSCGGNLKDVSEVNLELRGVNGQQLL